MVSLAKTQKFSDETPLADVEGRLDAALASLDALVEKLSREKSQVEKSAQEELDALRAENATLKERLRASQKERQSVVDRLDKSISQLKLVLSEEA
ncbi:MAG: hypothetical protein IT567_03550 [Alphaproteobacteria bacterium]|nr:hypothetical protein [Alphaproteobacteria bacterium]